MAKMTFSTPPPSTTKTEHGVEVVAATPPTIPAPPASAEPINTVDDTPPELKPAVVRIEDAPKQAPTIPPGTPAQLLPEQAARELVEVRALAVRALDEVRELMQKRGSDLAFNDGLVARLVHIEASLSHLSTDGIGSLRAELSGAVAAFRAAEDAAVVKLSQLLAEPARRIDAIDDVLLGLGQKTSRTTEPPVLTLRRTDPNRRYLAEPRVDGDAVVIPYSPRAGAAGLDPPDLRLSAGNTRNVFTGYAVDVPRGYACDVSVGEDVLMTIRGRGEAELVVPARTRAANMHVSQGGDLVRLSLRRLEVVSLKLG